jgi:hypothetical protein
VIQDGIQFIQSFETASGLNITLIENKMKTLDWKVIPPLPEEVQKYVFTEFFSGKNSSCYPVSDDILLTERMPAIELFYFCSPPSSDRP